MIFEVLEESIFVWSREMYQFRGSVRSAELAPHLHPMAEMVAAPSLLTTSQVLLGF